MKLEKLAITGYLMTFLATPSRKLSGAVVQVLNFRQAQNIHGLPLQQSVEWLERRVHDQHDLGAKSTRVILLYP